MKLNPYQANVSTEARGEDVPLVGLVEKLCLVPPVVLIVASIYHYSLLENPQLYRQSISIGVEVVALLLSVACSVLHFARFTSFCYLGKFRRALVSIFASVVTFIGICWAVWYDASTFLYAT